MGAYCSGFDTLFQARCLIAACFLQFNFWLLWGILAVGTRAAQRLVHDLIESVMLESMG